MPEFLRIHGGIMSTRNKLIVGIEGIRCLYGTIAGSESDSALCGVDACGS